MNGQGDKGTLTMNPAYDIYIYMYVCRQYAGPKSAKTNIALRVPSGRLHIGRLHVGRLHVGRLHVGRLSTASPRRRRLHVGRLHVLSAEERREERREENFGALGGTLADRLNGQGDTPPRRQ